MRKEIITIILIVVRQPSFFISRTNPFHPPPLSKKKKTYQLDTLQSIGHIHKSYD